MIRRWRGLVVPLVALVALLASGGWLVSQQRADAWGAGRADGATYYPGRSGMAAARSMSDGVMGGAGMTGRGGFGVLAGAGPVRDLPAARDRAEAFARSLGSGLRVGEVMRFTNQYYAELQGSDGSLATEVLVDPRTGTVRLEPGPAMMWNTRFGMMTAAAEGAGDQLTGRQAQAVAARWLQARGGLTAGAPEAFPGYYTMHTLRNGRIEGMLSVHAVSGAVWYHSWHGRFLTMSEGE